MIYFVLTMLENFLNTKSLTSQAFIGMHPVNLLNISVRSNFTHQMNPIFIWIIQWKHSRYFSLSNAEIKQQTDPHLLFLIRFLWVLLNNLVISSSSSPFLPNTASLYWVKSFSQTILYSPSHSKSYLLYLLPDSFDMQSWLLTWSNNFSKSFNTIPKKICNTSGTPFPRDAIGNTGLPIVLLWNLPLAAISPPLLSTLSSATLATWCSSIFSIVLRYTWHVSGVCGKLPCS